MRHEHIGAIMSVPFEDWYGACHGDIRVKPGRYGGGWIAVGGIIEEDWDERWSDLTCGDDDYFEARDYFEGNENFVFHEGVQNPAEAFALCLTGMQKMHNDISLKFENKSQ